jgi:hypothetical protein
MKRRNLAACAALALVVASAYCVQRARAELGERAFGLGQTLRQWLPTASGETQLELNGQLLTLATLSSASDARSLLDRFESSCSESALPPTAAAFESRGARANAQAFLNALRQDFGAEGGVAVCLAGARPQAGVAELLQKFAAYAQTGELSQFELRYLFVRRTARGSHGLMVWNAGPLAVRAMFPEHGDAAGSDLPGLPRPTGARRVLSARVPSRGYALAAYEVGDAPAAALAQYARQLAQLGFRSLPVAADQSVTALVRGADRVVAQSFRQDAQSVLAVVRIGDGAMSQEPADVH